MRFTWGPAKARKNLRSHGISFEAATEVFDDPNHVTNENYFIEYQGEQRYGMIGLTLKAVLLLVVFVDRTETDSSGKAGPETIHIIVREKGRQL